MSECQRSAVKREALRKHKKPCGTAPWPPSSGAGAGKKVAETFGVSYSAVRNWKKKHESGGRGALASGKRGRQIGAGRWLSAPQESQLRRAMIDSTPAQLKLPFMLWERRAVQELIARHFE